MLYDYFLKEAISKNEYNHELDVEELRAQASASMPASQTQK